MTDKILILFFVEKTHISKSHNFISELRSIRKHYQGRPTPVYYCNRLSEKYGARIYLKREDLNHTGAHKLNHCMGGALLAVVACVGGGSNAMGILLLFSTMRNANCMVLSQVVTHLILENMQQQ